MIIIIIIKIKIPLTAQPINGYEISETTGVLINLSVFIQCKDFPEEWSDFPRCCVAIDNSNDQSESSISENTQWFLPTSLPRMPIRLHQFDSHSGPDVAPSQALELCN